MRRPALALLLGCLLLVAGVSAIDGYSYYQTIEYAACDQETYQQDIVIHRSTGTAYNETAGGLETWHIYVGVHCREDYGDIRFTNSTGAELAYYLWPDYSSESARFCVRLERADRAGALVIWYGNPSATTTSDGDATYFFFDQFGDDALNEDKWDTSLTKAGTLTVSDGALAFAATSQGERYLLMKQGGTRVDFAGAYSVVARVKISTLSTSNARVGIVHKSNPSNGLGYNAVIANCNQPAFVALDDTVAWGTVIKSASANTWYTISCRHDGSKFYLREGDDPWTTLSWAGRSGTTGINLGYLSGVTDWFDYVLVRTYSATPPAALTFNGEQETAAPPVTAFTATPTSGLAPLIVQFTDTSAGSPTSWAWTFGDGNTSTAQNPQHTYAAPGLYTVTLNATNEYGSDTETKTDYITVYSPVTAQFTANVTGGTAPLTVQFTDLSTGGPTSWLWTFGDGNTSTAQNPQHTYTTAGTHTVTLTASHPYDSDTQTKTAYITVAVLQPFPGLTLIPRDLTGNGLYTDINGNNRLDYNDLTVFFQNLAWAKTAQPTSCFDFNGNNRLDYNDVITLFSIIMEEHT